MNELAQKDQAILKAFLEDFLEAFRKDMMRDAIKAAISMNDLYKEGDVERNRVSYGMMRQALRTLQMMGYKVEDATWEQANLLV